MISAAGEGGDGTITVRDKANQKQDVANLSRDTENANDSISPIFDKEKEQNRLKTVGLISDIGSQAVNIAQTQGEIAKRNAMSDPVSLNAAKAKLKAEGNANPTDKQIADQAGQTAMQQYGTGSPLQRGIQSVTAALKGWRERLHRSWLTLSVIIWALMMTLRPKPLHTLFWAV